MTTAAASLDLDDVSKRFGAVQALQPFSLAVAPGTLIALLGPSGCGKTTTLRIIAGFEKPDTGAVRINSIDITDTAPRLRSIGMVFQNYSLFPHMNAFENIAFGPKMRGEASGAIERRVGEMLELVQLAGLERRFPRELSGGQQQRVALARALITRPAILLLDEPLGALDKNLRESMQFELRQIQRRLGITSVLVTHDQEEALTMSDVVAVMRDGRVIQAGPPREIYDRPRTRFVSEFLGTSNVFTGVAASIEPPDKAVITLDDGSLTIQAHGAFQLRQPVEIAVRPERMWFTEGSIDQVNHLPVRITGHVFRGGYHAYEAQTLAAARKIFVHRMAEDEQRIWSIGDECLVCWRASASVALEEDDEA